VLCVSSNARVNAESGERLGPVHLLRDQVLKQIVTMQVLGEPGASYKVTYEPVQEETVRSICDSGFDVSALIKPLASDSTPKSAAQNTEIKTIIPPFSSLPVTFSIFAYQGQVYGNFWVPGTMPSNHNAHIVDYRVTSTNFHNASLGAHMVTVLTAVSLSNFDQDFDGKGFWFGSTTLCGSSTNPSFSSLAQTWRLNLATTCTSEGPVFNGSNIYFFPPSPCPPVQLPQALAPNTCSAMAYSTSGAGPTYRFYGGANRQQASVYWRYLGSSSTPQYQAPTITRVVPGYRTGHAGIALFVGGALGPLPFFETWNLSFTNATQRTQP
jgi:hypothetical protein